MVIYKYSLPFNTGNYTNEHVLEMPMGKVLSVQVQGDYAVLWVAIENPEGPKQLRTFIGIATGYEVQWTYPRDYIGTIQFSNGAYVQHIFEVMK